MLLMQHLLGSAIPMIVNIVILFYVCQRFFAATRLRRKIMSEMAEFTSIVRRARENVQFIGDQVVKGMEEIKGDVGEELRITDRLTTQNSKLTAMLGRFATLEENVIELVRMDRNRENVMIETPVDVNEEIRKIVATVEGKKNEYQEQPDDVGPVAVDVHRRSTRNSAHRNPLSKFSACGPREVAFAARKTIDDRPRTPTTPEVQLLGEFDRSIAIRNDSKYE
ncbi:uncharacterized protein LOC128886649 [Hylaeus anthracinus]|uniref:uncharacterized protein LOC128886649 n=1 Tax=Hylaeus anthracinus TaxID=313031 RepID=UPI0023B95628|nr:uncharacterized protein LOC128886649 [Hylaeus anthracinus]